MRLATYNIWNSGFLWPQRLDAIISQIEDIHADVVGLQEVPVAAARNLVTSLKGNMSTRYEHFLFAKEVEFNPQNEPDSPEGIMILSRQPRSSPSESWTQLHRGDNNWSLSAIIDCGHFALRVTNVHLDWKDPEGRCSFIENLLSSLQEESRTYDVLLGDFNEGDTGPVDKALCGRHGWVDAVREDATARGVAPGVTIGFSEGNPRPSSGEDNSARGRYDRVYLRPAPPMNESRMLATGIWGSAIATEEGTTASDHYGVYVDLDLKPLAVVPE